MKSGLIFLMPFFAQALEFKSFVDKTEVSLNETFKLKIEFQSGESLPDNIEVPALLDLKDFYFLDETSSQSISIQIINGQMEKTKTVVKSYLLQPKAVGSFTLPLLTVKADDKSFQTQSFKMTVLDKKSSGQQPKTPGSPFPNPFQNPPSLFQFLKPVQNQVKEDFKFKLKLSKKTLYKSEPLRADWFLLYSSTLPHIDAINSLSLSGFWKEEIRNKKQGTEAIEDTLYRKISVNSLWLFPLKTGELNIEPYSIQVNSDFSFQSQVLFSPGQKITVKDLPSEGLDQTFTGGVGIFELDYSIKETQAFLNQPLSFKITFKGSGHPRFINLSELPFPPSIEIYPPVQKSEFTEEGMGTKEFEILIIPKTEGQLTLPSLTLSTFNPHIGQYVYHKSLPFTFFVQKGDSQNNMSETFLEPVKDNKIKNSFSPLGSFFWPAFINYKNGMRIVVSLLILCLLILMAVWIKNFILKRKKSLKEKIDNQFLQIQKLIDKKNWQKACVNMIQLGTFVLDSAQIEEVSSNWRQALKTLPPSLNKKYAENFERLFKELESLSFSRQIQSQNQALKRTKKLFKQTKSLLSQFVSQL